MRRKQRLEMEGRKAKAEEEASHKARLAAAKTVPRAPVSLLSSCLPSDCGPLAPSVCSIALAWRPAAFASSALASSARLRTAPVLTLGEGCGWLLVQAEAEANKIREAVKEKEMAQRDKAAALERERSAAVMSLVGADAELADKVASLRSRCAEMIATHEVAPALGGDEAAAAACLDELERAVKYELVAWLCTNSVASYVACAELVGDKKQDLLHTVAAVAKDMQVPVEEEAAAEEPDAPDAGQDQDEEAAEPKTRRVRAIERVELSEYGSDTAYLLPKGSGVTYKPAVARRGVALAMLALCRWRHGVLCCLAALACHALSGGWRCGV
jgi:hypothetical protein